MGSLLRAVQSCGNAGWNKSKTQTMARLGVTNLCRAVFTQCIDQIFLKICYDNKDPYQQTIIRNLIVTYCIICCIIHTKMTGLYRIMLQTNRYSNF